MIKLCKIFITYSFIFVFLNNLCFAQYSMAELTGGDVSLPVTLISYNFEQIEKQIYVEWTVASEIDNVGFSIKRKSVSQNTFQLISSYKTNPDLLGEGNSSSMKKYIYIDKFDQFGAYNYKVYNTDLNGQENLMFSDRINTQPEIILPDQFSLVNIYPNPFNPTTNIAYYTPGDDEVKINIYNILGKKVTSFQNLNYNGGLHKVEWNAGAFSSGIYIVLLHYQNQTIGSRILYLK